MNLGILSQPLIAVFWSDVDTSTDNAGVVSFSETSNAMLLQKALEDVQRAYPAVSNIDYLFIATWDSVGYYKRMTDKVKTKLISSCRLCCSTSAIGFNDHYITLYFFS